MPELPEIETIKRDLEKKIIGKKIVKTEVREKKLVFPTPREFIKILTDNQFEKIERRGKLLIFRLAPSGQFLLAHMKMTGQLVYRYDHKTIYGGHDVLASLKLRSHVAEAALADGARSGPKTITVLPNQFTRVIFKFSDGSSLYFNDMRKFGYLKLVSADVKDKVLATRFGPDAFHPKPTFKVFKKILEVRPQSHLKAVLMDQQSIAGIGNIYADEICFRARLCPQRKINTLHAEEVEKLFKSVGHVLAHAVRHRGTTFGTRSTQNYVDSDGKHGNYLDFLKVYQRDKEPCLRCKKGIIQKDHTAGRGTRFCPVCQK